MESGDVYLTYYEVIGRMFGMSQRRFSDQIRDAVDASGMSRYRICAEIKISQSVMSRFMTGKGGLSTDVLDRLAELLKLSVAGPKRAKRGD